MARRTEENRRQAPHRIVPPDLRGRGHPDRMFRTMSTLVNGYVWIAKRSRPPRRPAPATGELTLRVERIRDEAQDVRSFLLADPDGAALPSWQPGSHLDVRLPSGRLRHYSLCGDPADRRHYRIAVRRIADGGGGSRELHDEITEGATLEVRGPRNGFPFVPADSYLFIAGGIGITPILPMVKQAALSRAHWRLVYAGRSLDSMPFLDELSTLDQARIEIRPDSHRGVPGSGAELLAGAPSGATVYCCGPSPLMAAVRADLAASRARALQIERFSAPPILDGRPFEVTLRRTGQRLTVPADQSALEAIRQVRPDVAYSCQQGFCGTCRTAVLAGAVDHRDQVLDPAERENTMTICVSRARDDALVLDL